MYILYTRKGCPHSKDVIDFAHKKHIEFKEKDIADSVVKEELISRGGKEQTPYFVDDTHDVSMYESKLIIAYMSEHQK